MLRYIASLFLIIFAIPTTALAQTTAAVESERMLTGVGGRAAWAEAHFYRIVAHHHPPLRAAGSHINIIEMDMAQPRMRFEARGPDIATLRMIDGEEGWRRASDTLQPMTGEDVANDRRWWEAHVYRMFYRIAVREPGLEPRLGTDGRLEFWKNGQFIMWYRLGVDGAPYMFGTTPDAARWTLLGPFIQSQSGGVRYPRWTAWSDGTFRTDSIMFEVGRAAPPTVRYRPDAK